MSTTGSAGSGIYPQLEHDTMKMLQCIEEARAKVTSQHGNQNPTLINTLAKLEADIKAFQWHARTFLNGFGQSQAELIDSLEKANNQFAALKYPPLEKATFVRAMPSPHSGTADTSVTEWHIEVRHQNGRSEIIPYLDKERPVSELKIGQWLLINKETAGFNVAVRALCETISDGFTGTIVEKLSADHLGERFLVSSNEQQSPQAMHCVGGLDMCMIEPGARVLADTAAGLILEVLQKEESGEEYLLPEVADVKSKDIGGLEGTKQDAYELFIDPILFPKAADHVGRKRPRGAVLVGPPGVGKTLIGKWIVNEIHRIRCEQTGVDPSKTKPLIFYLAGPEMQHWLVGKTEHKLRSAVARAQQLATPECPVGFIIDEADAFLGIRGGGISSDVEKTNVGTFNALVDGVEQMSGNVFFLLLTNLEDSIDNAVKRPGRCDRIIRVPRPNKEGVLEILKMYLKPEWGKIHPKYDEQTHTSKNRLGKPHTDASGRELAWHIGCDPKKARDMLVERAVERMFEETDRNILVELEYADGTRQIIRYRDLLSGAVCMDIVERAKRFADRRYTASLKAKGWLSRKDELVKEDPVSLWEQGIEPLGVEMVDLYLGIEQSFSEMKIPSSNQAMRNWLTVECLSDGRDIRSVALKGSHRR